MSAPTLTVGFANFGSTFANGEWRGLLDLARAADDAGVDRVVVVDHVVMGRRTDRYVWGTFPVPPEAPWLEPLTVLAAIGAATDRVRLATGILIAPLRPAAFLAKQVATLDQLAGGRVDLGVGTGWQREEYAALGLDFAARGQMLDDLLGALRVLWRDTPAEYSSPTVEFSDVFCEPKPLQPGGVPIWVAGTLHPRNLDRLVRHGDAWIPIMGESTEGIAAGAAQIREAWRAAGRDPEGLQVQAPLRIERDADGRADLARSIESVPGLVAAGATDIHLTLRAFARDAADAPAVLAEAVRRFRAVV
ncbi:MAG: TIGR03619 family F420-dependent LLM class oxidoreductase [Actinomycetota bacterium]